MLNCKETMINKIKLIKILFSLETSMQFYRKILILGETLYFSHTKSWLHLAPKNRKAETWYSIKCDVGANKNADEAFSMQRLPSHSSSYNIFVLLFVDSRWNQLFNLWERGGMRQTPLKKVVLNWIALRFLKEREFL